MPTFREHCSSLHQGEKQSDTVTSYFSFLIRKPLRTFKENTRESQKHKNIL